MGNLVHDLKHTITLDVLDGSSVLFVERVDVDIGSRVPAYSSAPGKALLAGLSETQIIQRLRRGNLKSRTTFQPKSIKEILTVIAKLRSSGFAVNNEDSTPGLVAVAVPIKSERDFQRGGVTGLGKYLREQK